MTNTSDIYIKPNVKIHTSFEDVSKFYEQYDGIIHFPDSEPVRLDTVAQGLRNLIVGEAGIGKSEFLNKLEALLQDQGAETKLVHLKDTNAQKEIESFCNQSSTLPKKLLLDALDEVQSNKLPDILATIENITLNHPGIAIFLSSRWLFIQKNEKIFPEYRFISISPFTISQAQEYLVETTSYNNTQIHDLLYRQLNFRHNKIIAQVPRYLSYLRDYLCNGNISSLTEVSRNDLFELFIDSKLKLEDEKEFTQKRDILRRILEKLALTMEINQTNVLSKDEFMTFFDELDSNLTSVALSQIPIERIYDQSLIKDNIVSIAFDNTELQEYLAAKEISRLPNINKATFQFATDESLKEIYPSWFNTLTFLVDMNPDLLEQLIDYSGLLSTDYHVVDESFIHFLSRLRINEVRSEVHEKLLTAIIFYHNKRLIWLDGNLADTLSEIYSPSMEDDLRRTLQEAEAQSNEKRYVPLSNICELVGYLFENKKQVDTDFWKSKMMEYIRNKPENEVLKRRSLYALGQLDDAAVLDSLPDLSDSEELVRRRFLNTCIKLDPDHKNSLKFFINAVQDGEPEGLEGIYAITKPESIKIILENFQNDSEFQDCILDQSSTRFGKSDKPFPNASITITDQKVLKGIQNTFITYLGTDYRFGKSGFIQGLWHLLKKNKPEMALEVLNTISKNDKTKLSSYFSHSFIANVIDVDDAEDILGIVIETEGKDEAYSLMLSVKHLNRSNATEIYEQGRKLIPEQYEAWEKNLANKTNNSKGEHEETLKEFRRLLEPEKGKYIPDVFDYYNQNRDALDTVISSSERTHLRELISETILKYLDPEKHNLRYENNNTYHFSFNFQVFGAALLTAQHLEMDLNEWRQKVINFIPFAESEQLDVIFNNFRDINFVELNTVMSDLQQKTTDLWRYHNAYYNVIATIEKFDLTDGKSLLKQIVKEGEADAYVRRKALEVVAKMDSDAKFLSEVFELYKRKQKRDLQDLAYMANGLLITIHGNEEAVDWRIKKITGNISSKWVKKEFDFFSEIGNEVHDKRLAKPLLDLKHSGFEDKYLALLDIAIKVWERGPDFHSYCNYLNDIVFSYFSNLKLSGSYTLFRKLEKKVSSLQSKQGANWLSYKLASVRRQYLEYLGKPRNISDAIKQYNDAKSYEDKKIRTSDDLFRHIQEAFDTDVRRWIEGEGAYELIVGQKVFDQHKQPYEVLIQKTIKAQLENILLRRGFDLDFIREPDLLDDKRVDFFVRYGLIGPIVIEIKLTTNSDMKGQDLTKSKSFESLRRYMQGYSATHGVFIVIKNNKTRKMKDIETTFSTIPNVNVMSFECQALIESKKKPAANSNSRKSTTKASEKKAPPKQQG